MIKRIDFPKYQKKMSRRKLAQAQQQAVHQRAQITTNAALWQIIRQNAEANEEDFDATKPTVLTIPKESFKDVPQGFGLQIKQDDKDNIIIVASGVEEKSDLIVRANKIIGG